MPFDFEMRETSYLVSTWRGESTVEEVDRFFALYREELEKARHEQRRLVVVIDFTTAEMTSSAVRKQVGIRLREIAELRQIALKSTYLVVPNAIIRGSITAVGWLVPAVRAMTATATLEEAEGRACKDLAG